MSFENFKQSGAEKEQEIPQNLESDTLKKIDLNAVEEKIKNAKPSTLEKIGNALKNKGTWAGMLGIAMGAYLVDRAFNHQGEIAQNIMENMTDSNGTPDPEKIRNTLLLLKGFATTVLTTGGFLTYAGYEDGNNPHRDYVKYKNEGYLHKDTFTDKRPNFEDGFITNEEWLNLGQEDTENLSEKENNPDEDNKWRLFVLAHALEADKYHGTDYFNQRLNELKTSGLSFKTEESMSDDMKSRFDILNSMIDNPKNVDKKEFKQVYDEILELQRRSISHN